MNRPGLDPLNWQQLMAAYADGELNAAARARFRRWLDSNPDAYSQLEVQRSLSPTNAPFCAAVEPPMPDAAAWARMWSRIHGSLDATTAGTGRPSESRAGWWRRGLWAALLAAPCAAAAAAVLAISLQPSQRPDERPSTVIESDELFQVAAHTDVEILSIHDADVPQLVIGEPPCHDPLLLVTAGDVRVENMQPARDGMVPEVDLGGNNAPMIYAPVSRAP